MRKIKADDKRKCFQYKLSVERSKPTCAIVSFIMKVPCFFVRCHERGNGAI